MLSKRIIACLDIKNGRTVKGINFKTLVDAGDPVELASLYAEAGIDELTFLDISATIEKRKTLAPLVERIASKISIPFTVGGGITCCDDVALLLDSGADKISVNSRAVADPSLIDRLSSHFGCQCIVAAVDTMRKDDRDEVYVNGGRTATGIDTIEWVQELEKRGAGEILLTSMDHDGVKEGFSLNLTDRIARSVNIPVIASGGAGKMEHFSSLFKKTKADAALAASIFHFSEIAVNDLKKYLQDKGLSVRTL